jgi:hypothetical protein
MLLPSPLAAKLALTPNLLASSYAFFDHAPVTT